MRVRSGGNQIETGVAVDLADQWSSSHPDDTQQTPLTVDTGASPRWRAGLAFSAVSLAALSAIGVMLLGPLVEKTLTSETQSALRLGSIPGAVVSYDGRDATIRVPEGIDPAQARLLVRTGQSQGPRTVRVIVDKSLNLAPQPSTSSVRTIPTGPNTTLQLPSPDGQPGITAGEPIIPEEGSVTQDSVSDLQVTLDELVGSQTIEFSNGNAILTSRGLSVVKGVARLINETSSNIEVIAFADDATTSSDNQALSDLRANSVKAALVKAGVERSRIQATGAGIGQRRVEVRVVG